MGWLSHVTIVLIFSEIVFLRVEFFNRATRCFICYYAWKWKKNNKGNSKLFNEISLADQNNYFFLKNVRGKIVVGHFHGRGIIIIFFEIEGFGSRHINCRVKIFILIKMDSDLKLVQLKCLDCNNSKQVCIDLNTSFHLERGYFAKEMEELLFCERLCSHCKSYIFIDLRKIYKSEDIKVTMDSNLVNKKIKIVD